MAVTEWSLDDVLAAARAIRPHLSSLVENHKDVDRRIAEMLERANTQADVELDLVDALTETEVLRRWTAEFLKLRCPPQVSRTRMGIAVLQLSGPVAFERYACPRGDYDWYRFSPGDRVPPCPTHRVLLVVARPREE
jgi:hypothetical protein